MYLLQKRIQISAAHCLPNYDGPCKNVHGHNWNIVVHCACKDDELKSGMVIDFTEIKNVVKQFDHVSINNYIENPTAENIAKWLCDNIPRCFEVEVEETDGNLAIYVNDERKKLLL